MPRLFQALALAPWIAMTTNKRIRLAVLKQNEGLACVTELFEVVMTFK